MKTVTAGDLEVAYLDYGPSDGFPVILLHGFPYDVSAYYEVADALSKENVRCLVPYLRGYGPTKFLSGETMRSGQQAALAYDLLAFMDAMSIQKAVLGGYDWGGRSACIVAALWPDRVAGLVSCGQGYNIQDIPNAWKPAPAEQEARFWYQYYFNTRRGEAGLSQKRKELCHHIWKLWSPTWNFDEVTFDETAQSFENADFVDVVIHSYRHRYGDLDGDQRFDEIEAKLANCPSISAPTVVLEGQDDGVNPPPVEDVDRPHFTGAYRRVMTKGVGHNFPQEAPEVFAEAVLSLLR